MTTILIAGGGTGGHLMPALALAEALRREHPDVEPVLMGAERGVEAQLLPLRDFRYHLLPAEPIYRRDWWKNLRWPFIAGRLLNELERIFREERPAVVVGTGGYASAPAVWLALRRGIPSAIQEQNAFPGLASRWLSRGVDHVYLGLPEARARLRFGPHTQVFDTGNPIVPPDPSRRDGARHRFGLRVGSRVLLITGGSQGALALNEVVAEWLSSGGGRDMTVLWVTGRGTFSRFQPYHQPPAVQVLDFLDPMADGYAVSDLVVSRAGMMTVAELCAWGLPSILVPLPTAAADHQTCNAKAIAAAGAAMHLPQQQLSPHSLGSAIASLLQRDGARQQMAARAKDRGKPEAAREIVSRIFTLVA